MILGTRGLDKRELLFAVEVSFLVKCRTERCSVLRRHQALSVGAGEMRGPAPPRPPLSSLLASFCFFSLEGAGIAAPSGGLAACSSSVQVTRLRESPILRSSVSTRRIFTSIFSPTLT